MGKDQDVEKELETGGRETVKNIEKTIELLEFLSQERKAIGVREAGRVLDMSKSTVQRIFNSLLVKNIVTFNESTEMYSLSPGIIRLALPFLQENILKTISAKPMDELRDQIGETIGLHIHVNGKQVLLHQSDSKEELKWSIPVGKPYPINVGASGKVLLAGMDEEHFQSASLHFDRLTDHTKQGEELLQELKDVRKQGYADSYGEFSVGEMGLAVPVFSKGKVVASLSVYGPVARLGQKNKDEVISLLKATSSLITQQMD